MRIFSHFQISASGPSVPMELHDRQFLLRVMMLGLCAYRNSSC